MAVTLVVEKYPFTGATSIVAEELTSYGWVEVLDTATIGTFPDYTTTYQVTPTSESGQFRYSWHVGASPTTWLAPLSVQEAPTAAQEEVMAQAIIQKATRIYLLAQAPLGHHGEMTDFGFAVVRPDYEIQELLYGMRLHDWAVDLTTLVTTDDVIRVGLQTDPDDLPVDKVADVQRALTAAIHWVGSYMLEGVALA